MMETKKTSTMPFGKKALDMPACCRSFMVKMEQSGSCCGMAEMMDEAECESETSPEQNECSSETTESSEGG